MLNDGVRKNRRRFGNEQECLFSKCWALLPSGSSESLGLCGSQNLSRFQKRKTESGEWLLPIGAADSSPIEKITLNTTLCLLASVLACLEIDLCSLNSPLNQFQHLTCSLIKELKKILDTYFIFVWESFFFDNLFGNYDWVKKWITFPSFGRLIWPHSVRRWMLMTLKFVPTSLCLRAHHHLTALLGYLMGILELRCSKWNSECLS